jgi:cytochrome c biogenesis protein CcmG/thiol:disulfide interchange protein DsbE
MSRASGRRLGAGVALLAIIVVVAVVLSAPLARSPGDGPLPSEVLVGGSPLLGKPLPDIALRDLDGAPVRLADFRGHPLIVNIWGSWCIPCRAEFPQLVGANGEYRDEGLQMVGIVRKDSAESARAFAAQQGATWPMLLDTDEVAWRALIGVGVPQTYFVDADGIVRWVNIGPFSPPGLAYGLSRILPSTASPGPVSS